MTAPTHVRYQPSGAFRCAHCGESYLPTYPCPIGALRALSTWFVSTHSDCLPLRSLRRPINYTPSPSDPSPSESTETPKISRLLNEFTSSAHLPAPMKQIQQSPVFEGPGATAIPLLPLSTKVVDIQAYQTSLWEIQRDVL